MQRFIVVPFHCVDWAFECAQPSRTTLPFCLLSFEFGGFLFAALRLLHSLLLCIILGTWIVYRLPLRPKQWRTQTESEHSVWMLWRDVRAAIWLLTRNVIYLRQNKTLFIVNSQCEKEIFHFCFKKKSSRWQQSLINTFDSFSTFQRKLQSKCTFSSSKHFISN